MRSTGRSCPSRRWMLGAVWLSLAAACTPVEPVRVSRLGEYRGFTSPVYREWVRSSRYLEVRDGTQLAADIFRPARNGQAVEEALPVLLSMDRYRRSFEQEGRLSTQLDEDPWLTGLLEHGYVIVVADSRGSGASLGSRYGPFGLVEIQDTYDVTEWLAGQSWCDGNVGMIGVSYRGANQLMAATAPSPSLKAIFPEMAIFDMYHFAYPGGIFRQDFVTQWNTLVRLLDVEQPAAPVDEDGEREILAQAIEAHKENGNVLEIFERLPYRDSVDPVTATRLHEVRSPGHHVEALSRAAVPIYHFSGWYDAWPRDALTAYRNLKNPQKLTIGPWSHTQFDRDLWLVEHLRWFDYWLKGIDNGIVDEPPIHYYTLGADPASAWRSTTRWPPREQIEKELYLLAGPSGTVRSANDGLLGPEPPAGENASDGYVVDYTATTGRTSRWADAYGAGFGYPDLRGNDAKGLTYTTPPLEAALQVTGHPVVHLWVTSSAPDADFFVYLEEVDRQGKSHYVTEGALRASHRATHEAPIDYLGLPYHRSFEEDVVDLPSAPVELRIDLHPTSKHFPAGHRIRVTITGADRDNTRTPELAPPPEVRCHRGPDYPSRILLPLVPASAR